MRQLVAMRIGAIAAAIAVIANALSAYAQEQELYEPDEQGLTLNVGYAPGFSGLGAGIGYTGSVSPDVHIMPYVGVGALDIHRIHDGHDTRVVWGPGGGVLFMQGGRHRLVIDVAYGIVNHEVFNLHGYEAGLRALWGVSTMFGYAFVTQRGFTVRGEVGPGFVATPYVVGSHINLQLGLVVGYTFR